MLPTLQRRQGVFLASFIEVDYETEWGVTKLFAGVSKKTSQNGNALAASRASKGGGTDSLAKFLLCPDVPSGCFVGNSRAFLDPGQCLGQTFPHDCAPQIFLHRCTCIPSWFCDLTVSCCYPSNTAIRRVHHDAGVCILLSLFDPRRVLDQSLHIL